MTRVPRPDVTPRAGSGTCSVSVTRPAGRTTRFRHLADGGRWFDDPQATTADEQGSLLVL